METSSCSVTWSNLGEALAGLAELRGSCSRRSLRYALCRCVDGCVTSNSRLLCFSALSRPALGESTVNLIWGQTSNTFSFCRWPRCTPLPPIRYQAKPENKNLKCVFPFLSLDLSLSASSISFERNLKCQSCVHKHSRFFYGVWIHAVGLFHVSFLMISPVLDLTCYFVRLDYQIIWLDGNIVLLP